MQPEETMHLTAHFRGPTTGWMSARHQLVGFNPNSCLYVRFYICALSENTGEKQKCQMFCLRSSEEEKFVCDWNIMSVWNDYKTVRLKPSAH